MNENQSSDEQSDENCLYQAPDQTKKKGFYGRLFPPNAETRGYNTFKDTLDNSVKSVSLPYGACNSRTMADGRLAALESKEIERSKSTGNIIGVADYSVERLIRNETVDEPSRDVFCCGYSKRQLKCGIALCALSIVDTMGFAIFAPFFPIVAEKMELSEVHIGLIFAAFSIGGIFASIFTGTLLVRLGAKFIILSGMFWSSGATICFGLLNMSPPEYFFYLCFACRLLMGIGSASAYTALFAIIFQEFSNRALTVIGISESLCSIGGITGPVIGGALYDAGGYITPFMSLGALQFGVFVVCAALLPPVAVERQADAVSPAWLLFNLHGLFSALFVVIAFMVNSFIKANLSLFLIHSFGISTLMVGVFFLVSSISYGISTPIWGHIANSKNIGAHMMAGSCLLEGLVLTFYGPADVWMRLFGWSEPREWLVYVTAGLSGALMGALIMPTFGEMLVAAKQMKLHNNELAEYGLVSGLWNTVFSIGDILGPTVGGAIVQEVGFGNTSAILGLAMAALALAKIVHLIYLGCLKRNCPPGGDREAELASDEEERKSLLSADRPSLQA